MPGDAEEKEKVVTPAQVAMKAYHERFGIVGEEAYEKALASFGTLDDKEQMFTLTRLTYLAVASDAFTQHLLQRQTKFQREQNKLLRELIGLMTAPDDDTPADAAAPAEGGDGDDADDDDADDDADGDDADGDDADGDDADDADDEHEGAAAGEPATPSGNLRPAEAADLGGPVVDATAERRPSQHGGASAGNGVRRPGKAPASPKQKARAKRQPSSS